MDNIFIYHAFDGFIYAPLFLANEMSFFPKNCKLIPAGGDREAIEFLCSHTDNGENISFAICDPFSIDLNKALEHTNDELCVIASLINVIPLWIFNTNKRVEPVKMEKDLAKYKSIINRIILYPSDTTGNLIGKRIQKILDVQDHSVEIKQFGQEFMAPISDQDIIITADVLRMVHYGLNANKVVFPYPTRAPLELQPFLFTAILTLRSTVESNLWAVLSVLGAIRTAINCMMEKNIEQKYIDALKIKYDSTLNELKINTEKEKDKLIKDTIYYLVHTEKIYANFPKPKKYEDWIKSWDNAREEWMKENTSKEYPTVKEHQERIPALLVQQEWKIELAEYFKEIIYENKNDPTLLDTERKEFITPFNKLILLLGYFFIILSSILLYRATIYTFFIPLSTEPYEYLSIWLWGMNTLLFIAQIPSFFFLRKAILSLSKFEVEIAIHSILLAIFAAFIFRVLEI